MCLENSRITPALDVMAAQFGQIANIQWTGGTVGVLAFSLRGKQQFSPTLRLVGTPDFSQLGYMVSEMVGLANTMLTIPNLNLQGISPSMKVFIRKETVFIVAVCGPALDKCAQIAAAGFESLQKSYEVAQA